MVSRKKSEGKGYSSIEEFERSVFPNAYQKLSLYNSNAAKKQGLIKADNSFKKVENLF
jgi:hypothetical protein